MKKVAAARRIEPPAPKVEEVKEEEQDESRKEEVDGILLQLCDLQRWREIFNSRRVELQHNITRAVDLGQEEKQEVTGGFPVCGEQLPVSDPYCVPRTLSVSPSLGGQPVTPEMAKNLRQVLFGGTFHVFSLDWRKSVFRFRAPHSALAYALETERGGVGAVQMAVQAHIIKHLLFSREVDTIHTVLQSLSELGVSQQDQALAAALTDILWVAGEERMATVTLVTTEYCTTPQLDYKMDSVTERLQLFSFSTKEEVVKFIRDHILCFKAESSHGVILFLYSLICSRTLSRVQQDLDCTTSHLLNRSLGTFVCRQALLNLLLSGRACPHVFNGTQRQDERVLHGIQTRNHIGFLRWSRERWERESPAQRQVGSMLKTPVFPVWLCSINGTFSVLFSPKRSLLRDWKVEHLFQLHFYSGQLTQSTTTWLTVDTHSHHWESDEEPPLDPERRFPSLEMMIRTKWAGAAIKWNGTTPFY